MEDRRFIDNCVCYRLVGLRRANRSQSADNKTTNVSNVGRLSDKLLLAFEYDCPGNTSCVSDYVIGVFSQVLLVRTLTHTRLFS